MSHTGQNLGRPPPRLWRIAAASVCGIGAIAAISWLALPAGLSLRRTVDPASVLKETPPPLPTAPLQVAPVEVKPGFDVVRVGAHGGAVIAGRATPQAEISVRAGGQEIAHTSADDQGQWVVTPDQNLSPGAHELTVVSRTPSGRELAGEASVLLMVPGPSEAATAVLLPGDAAAAPKLLAVPARAATGGAPQIDVTDYDEAGDVRLLGRAGAGLTVRLYLDNGLLGETAADAAGAWSLAPHRAVAPGHHVVRVDQLAATGAVLARTEVPLDRDMTSVPAGHLVVQPGQTLWRIARRVYGQGTRYTIIYEANRERIRDPARIYPGQTFAIPERRAGG